MIGDKGSARLVKFWWVLASMIGATAGAISVSCFGISNTIWGIAGVGLPIGAAIGYIEWCADRRPAGGRRQWSEVRLRPSASQRSHSYKENRRRGQLHAFTGRK